MDQMPRAVESPSLGEPLLCKAVPHPVSPGRLLSGDVETSGTGSTMEPVPGDGADVPQSLDLGLTVRELAHGASQEQLGVSREIEDRGVSAEFLLKFTKDMISNTMTCQATRDAIAYLKQKIETTEGEIVPARERARNAERREWFAARAEAIWGDSHSMPEIAVTFCEEDGPLGIIWEFSDMSISHIVPSSPAERHGLQAGMLCKNLNGLSQMDLGSSSDIDYMCNKQRPLTCVFCQPCQDPLSAKQRADDHSGSGTLVAKSASRRGATSDEQGPLPKGWKWRTDTKQNEPHGRRMYYNRDTGESSWKRPGDGTFTTLGPEPSEPEPEPSEPEPEPELDSIMIVSRPVSPQIESEPEPELDAQLVRELQLAPMATRPVSPALPLDSGVNAELTDAQGTWFVVVGEAPVALRFRPDIAARIDAVVVPGEEILSMRTSVNASIPDGWIMTTDKLWLPREFLAEQPDHQQAEPSPMQATRDLIILERALRMYREDLEKREERPYMTSRDVHQRVVVAKTGTRMCRFVELPGVHNGYDAEGNSYVGRARHFFSYSWDSPWDDLVTAIVTHTQKVKTAGESAPYYWIDIFAVNQHLATPPWKCTSGRGAACPGCAAVDADMHDWDAPSSQPAKGFERVISKTKHTLVLMEPWRNPRPPQRVWCLFEGYQTLAKGGKLEVLLGPQQQLDLRSTLSVNFAAVRHNVDSIDALLAEATVEKDRMQIFGAIKKLPGGFSGLNKEMRRAQRQWLVSAATDCLQRTDPTRAPLGTEAMIAESVAVGATLAKISRFLEAWPRVPAVLWMLIQQAVVICLSVMVLGALSLDSEILLTSEVAFYAAIFALRPIQVLLMGHQADRQLRAPPPLGLCAIVTISPYTHDQSVPSHTQAEVWTAQLRHIAKAADIIVLWSILLWLNIGIYSAGSPIALFSTVIDLVQNHLWVQVVLPLAVWTTSFCAGVFVLYPAYVARDRLSVAEKTSILQLELGETKEMKRALAAAHAELQAMCGTDDAEFSFEAAPGLSRSLIHNGQTEEAEALRSLVDAKTRHHAVQWKRYLRIYRNCKCVRSPWCCRACNQAWLLFLGGLYLLMVLVCLVFIGPVLLALKLIWEGLKCCSRRCEPCRRCGRASRRCYHRACCSRGILVNVAQAYTGVEIAGSRSYWWWQRGALLRARMAAAVRAPDAEVLALLTEAGSTNWGKVQVLDSVEKPELAEFLERMRNSNVNDGATTVEERALYAALPPSMRSQGDNPNSQWKKLTCAGRSYFRRIDTRQVTSLDAPSEGVCQNAEFDLNGELMPVQPPSTVEWLLGPLGTSFNKDAWESAYADLGGPGCWSSTQNRVYKRKLMAQQISKAIFAASVFLLWFLMLIGNTNSILNYLRYNNYSNMICPPKTVGDIEVPCICTTPTRPFTCEWCQTGWFPGAIPKLQGAGTDAANGRYYVIGTSDSYWGEESPLYFNNMCKLKYVGSSPHSGSWSVFENGLSLYRGLDRSDGKYPPNSWWVDGDVGDYPVPKLTWCIAT